MLEHGLEGPPEQETDIPKANTHAIDKWAQEETHRPKGKVGGPTGGFSRPTWSAELPVGPTAFRFHMEVSHWLLMSV